MEDAAHTSELVERARGGDQDALSDVFTELRDRLLASIRSRLGAATRQVIDPEDVLQDAFVRAFHSLERFEWRGEESLRRWLESIATHVALDAVRRQRRRRVLQIDHDVPGDAPSPSHAMRRSERFERLRASMETLSEEHRTVLTLSRIDGLSLAEIAARMQRSESAVKNLLLRAMRQLKRSFGDTEGLSLGDAHLGSGEESNDR